MVGHIQIILKSQPHPSILNTGRQTLQERGNWSGVLLQDRFARSTPLTLNPLYNININMSKRICLFDVDGTLTIARGGVKQEMIDTLKELQKYIDVGVVGGSDLVKIREQLTDKVLDFVDFTFSQNGLRSFRGKQPLPAASIKDFLGEDKLKEFINFCLRYLADLDIPIKRGTFIEYRAGMLNVSPIGRNCSQQERDEFEKYDKEHKIRQKFIAALKEKFPDIGLSYSIGGQISFDVFPNGWNKTYCLRFLDEYEEIHFFGDKTFEGGNDYEIYEHIRSIDPSRAFSVKGGPEQTISILRERFMKFMK